MAIANMSRYFGVDYYQGLILPTTASEDEINVKVTEAVRRNMAIRDTAFCCPNILNTIPGERGFSLWTTYPGIMMGIGYPHDSGLEGNICAGFSFDYVTGLPYLPGSSVKGALRSAFNCPEYIRELMENETVNVTVLERVLFGKRPKDTGQMPDEGKVTFLDTFPIGSCDPIRDAAGKLRYKLLELEAITPHHTEKLGPLLKINPLTFLKLRPGVELHFHFLCPENILYGEGMCIHVEAVLKLFKAILLDLGTGAKTNVGFGRLTDEKPDANTPVNAQVVLEASIADAEKGISQGARQVRCKTCGKPTDINKNTGRPQPFCKECRRKHWLEINAQGQFTAKEMKILNEKEMNLMSKQNQQKQSVYSYHTFIFPFLWNNGGEVKRDTFERCIDRTRWTLDLFDVFHDKKRIDLMRKERYAQYQYFNAPARSAIYTTKDSQGEIVRNFLYRPEYFTKDDTGSFYIIKKGDHSYKLRINGLRLKLYASGIGLLVYELENTEYHCMDAVKLINEYGRRIYCPYIDDVKNLKSSLTADSIHLEGAAFSLGSSEDEWRITADANDEEKMPQAKLAKVVTMLLTNGSISVTNIESETCNDRLYIEPIIDDRMFVACIVQDKPFIDRMKEWNGSEYSWLSDALEKETNAIDSVARQLYEFVFVDTDTKISCRDRQQLHRLLKKHIYTRWIESETIYGVTEYSIMACVSQEGSPFVVGPFLTQYIELAILAHRGLLLLHLSVRLAAFQEILRRHGI